MSVTGTPFSLISFITRAFHFSPLAGVRQFEASAVGQWGGECGLKVELGRISSQ